MIPSKHVVRRVKIISRDFELLITLLLFMYFLFRILYGALSIKGKVWIGLSDVGSENTWLWINGKRIAPDAVFWTQGQPDNGRNEDCGEIIPDNPYSLGVNDAPCTLFSYALCEKIYTP